jgi:hypothetical protein
MNQAVKLERERRKTQREERLFELINRREVVQPVVAVLGMVALQKLGEARLIQRDFAGMLLAAWTAYCAANAGITDKYALGAITAASTAAYSISTPTREDEAIVTVNPGKLLGGDGKLFWWDIPFVPDSW